MTREKIYTRAGDDGTTGLFYGGRVGKDSALPRAYGAVDEAQAILGLVRAEAGKAFDVPYHANLSGDALAVFITEAGRLPAPTCAALSTALGAHWTQRVAESSGDWRSESLSSRRAREWYAAGATLPCRAAVGAQ